jgi:hypothetical protein
MLQIGRYIYEDNIVEEALLFEPTTNVTGQGFGRLYLNALRDMA